VYLKPFQVALTAEVTGTMNATAQFTTDDVFGGAPGPYTWFPIAGLTGITATAAQSLVAPVTAVRLLTNSGTGTAKFSVVQAGAAF